MKQSDIEEIKAILWFSLGVFAYCSDLIILAVFVWVLAALSLGTACVVACYERKIKELKHKLEQGSRG